jgi:signal transduction histidine kinase
VNGRRRLLAHAARVATMATIVVLACYVLCAFGLGVFVTHRLTAEADGRIRAALSRASSISLHATSSRGSRTSLDSGDLDDAPVFYWYVPAHGQVEALTVGAPRLPRRSWNVQAVTRSIGETTFRFAAVRRGDGWVVAGQNISEVGRVQSALFIPEVLFGLLLALATFVGSLLVGLRASAPLELIRRRQSEFTADASHELRTPLSVVEAEVDLALRRRREPEEYEAVLHRIAGESRRLRYIVDDLLWLARADSGADAKKGSKVANVEAVVASCVDRFDAVATRNGVSLGFTAEGLGNGVVKALPELVDRLAGALIDNACKYAGPNGTVSVTVRSTPTRVVLRVDDSGPGIPLDQRAAVFDRFHRATANGPGSGLGLAIADSVVRMTGGSWSVGDADLGGTRMEVSWRRVPEGEHPQTAHEPRIPGDDGPRDTIDPGRLVTRIPRGPHLSDS